MALTTRIGKLGGEPSSNQLIKEHFDQFWLAGHLQWTRMRKEKRRTVKLKIKWSVKEELLGFENANVLNSILNVVEIIQFKIISTYESARTGCDILETTY